MNGKYLMRSMMFVPGHNRKLLASASRSAADVLLLDLEDSVQPHGNKQIARDTIQEFVEDKVFDSHVLFPRVNDRESGHLLKDVQQLTIPGIHGFMYPKSKKGEDVYFFDKLLETIEYEKSIPIGTYKIVPLIETAAAVANVQEIIQASQRVIAIAFGCEDFIADLGGIHDSAGESIFTPRAIIAIAAKANNVTSIDTVHINVHDLDDLENNLKTSVMLGYEGMLVLHPKELPLVHEYYSPSKEKIQDAQEMLDLAKQAFKEGKGVAIKDGKFIGPPMISTAKKILEKAKKIEQKDKI